MTIELVTSPVICMECGREYKRIVSPPDFPGRPSHAYCSACIPIVEERWFGNGGDPGAAVSPPPRQYTPDGAGKGESTNEQKSFLLTEAERTELPSIFDERLDASTIGSPSCKEGKSGRPPAIDGPTD